MNNSTFNTEAALGAVDLTDALANSSLNIEPEFFDKIDQDAKDAGVIGRTVPKILPAFTVTINVGNELFEMLLLLNELTAEGKSTIFFFYPFYFYRQLIAITVAVVSKE